MSGVSLVVASLLSTLHGVDTVEFTEFLTPTTVSTSQTNTSQSRVPRSTVYTTVTAPSTQSSTSSPAVSPEEGAAWDALAQCESSGNWSINTGNGFYGGLQFHPQTWIEFGGDEYAPYAHLATREQQIEIAKKVLAVQGWGAWPACTTRLGYR